MLLARTNWQDSRTAQRSVSRIRIVKRQQARKSASVTRYLISILLMIFMGFLYLGLAFQSMVVDQNLTQLSEQVSQLKTENERLSKIKDDYSSFRRLENVAYQELGLVQPTATQLIAADN